MVAAGFAATVAPLGTALTEEQLALLWRMADEPILCFDGDKAGRRAAYRAVDIALPLLEPGKSLRFALLPDGQDPDDLVARGGPRGDRRGARRARGRSPTCCGRARPRRPARHAGAPRGARGAAPRGHHGDRRRDGAQILSAGPRRARAQSARARGPAAAQRPRWRTVVGQSKLGRGTELAGRQRLGRSQTARSAAVSRAGRGPALASGTPYVVASPQLAASAVHRGRAGIPLREALILQAAINHPWLLHDHLEDISGIEFRQPDAEKLKLGLIDIAADDGAADGAAMRGGAIPSRPRRSGRADREGDHDRLGLGGAPGGRSGGRADDMESAHCLATAMALLTLGSSRTPSRRWDAKTTEANYSWLQEREGPDVGDRRHRSPD